jgi:hypothetical protein|tara:strand:- start:119 stop:481 length:363 start_codon:yes stop_codon:yes gene_type:complete
MRPVTKFEVAFPKDLLAEIKKQAGKEKAYVGEFIVSAVEGYMMGPHEVTTTSPPIPVKIIEEAVEKVSEPSLATTEEGFKMGVEAACEFIAKSARLNVKMSTGMSMGEDMALRIKKDLLG